MEDKIRHIAEAADCPEQFVRYIATKHPRLLDLMPDPPAESLKEKIALLLRNHPDGMTIRQIKKNCRLARRMQNKDILESIKDMNGLKEVKTKTNTPRFFYVIA